MNKIVEVVIEPLKMGKVRTTEKIRETECRIIYIYENGEKRFTHVETKEGGIREAYEIAVENLYPTKVSA